MKTLRLFPLELGRLLRSRLTWLVMLLTVLGPVVGLYLYQSAVSTMNSLYLANPAIAGGIAGGSLFGLLAILELDRACRSRVDVLVDAVVSPLTAALTRLSALLTTAVLTTTLTMLVWLPISAGLIGAVFDMVDYVLAYLLFMGLALPLGVLLVAGDKDGVLPLPGWLMHILNIVINILRSVPFLILMICVFPLTRAIVGTTVGTKATIVPLVVAAFPFVARLVETSLRELDEGVVEAAQSMGATPFQIITKVMIPECLPGLISSMTTALTTILGYSAMSGVIGGGGLGKIALSYGYYRYQTNIMIVCVVLLVLMVQVFQTVGTFWATRSDKRLRK